MTKPVDPTWPEGASAVPEMLSGVGRIETHGGDFASTSTVLELEPTPSGATVRILTAGEQPLTTTLTHDLLGAIASEIRARLPIQPSAGYSKAAYVVRLHLPFSGGAIGRELHEVGPWPGAPTLPNAEYVGMALHPLVELLRTLISSLQRRAI